MDYGVDIYEKMITATAVNRNKYIIQMILQNQRDYDLRIISY